MRGLANLALLAVACDGTSVVQAPPEVTFAAVLEPTVRSPLVPVGEATLLLAESLGDATLVGFRSEDLSSPALEVDTSEPLAIDERGCGLLPAASVAWRWEGSDALEVDPPSSALTARWMETGCPVPRRLSASCRNSFRVCAGPATVLSTPCAWSIGCEGGGTLAINPGVWPSTRGCGSFETDRAPMRTERWSDARDRYTATIELGDDTCAIEGSMAETPPLPLPAMDVITVWQGESQVPVTLDTGDIPKLDARTTRSGGITGFVLDPHNRRAIVAVTDGFICPTASASTSSGLWRTIDLDSLEVSTSTLTAPPCLMGLRKVSAEGEPLRMVGFNIDAERRLAVSEFDEHLRLKRRVTLGPRISLGMWIADVVITPSRYFVLSTQNNNDPEARVMEVNATTLRATQLPGPPIAAALSLELGPGGALFAHTMNTATVCRIGDSLAAAPCEQSCGNEIFSPASTVVKFNAFARDPADGSLVLGGSDSFHGLFGCGRDLWLRQAIGGAQIAALHALGPGRILVSAVGRWGGPGDTQWAGRLMIADLELGGFEAQTWALPGTLASSLVRDGEFVWAVMPWDGVVARWPIPR